MKFRLPELVIAEDEGFAEEKDIFKRKQFGDRLGNLLSRSEGLVIALDGGWGEGKTTFINMWRGHVKTRSERRLETIYFDAFQNDFQQDAFLAIATELIDYFPNSVSKNLITEVSKVGKAILRGGLRLGVKAGTAGLLDGTELEDYAGDISNVVNNRVDTVLTDRISQAKKDKESVSGFAKYLEKQIEEIESDNPIVFIIDELDRCRPDFALEVLEVIKHFYSVKGLSFLLIVNRYQLEAAIKKRYGDSIEASYYLEKFVHLFLNMPSKGAPYSHTDSKTFFSHCIKEMCGQMYTPTLRMLGDLVTYYEPSFRQIERLVGLYNVAIFSELDHHMKSAASYDLFLLGFIIWVHVYKPELVEEITAKSENGLLLIQKSRLIDYQPTNYDGEEIRHMRDLIAFDKGTDEERSKALSSPEQDNYAAYLFAERSPADCRNRLVIIGSKLAAISENYY